MTTAEIIIFLFGERELKTGRRLELLERIADNCKVVDRGYVAGPCLEWQGGTSGSPGRGRQTGRGHSYPRMSLEGSTVAVHRAVWVSVNGYLPSKKQLDHKCENRICVRPSHLEPVTHLVNQKRKTKR